MVPVWIGCPATNFHVGRRSFGPEAIVVHIMDGSFEAGESVFRDPSTQKSAHYGISKAGVVHQYVDENDTAFHAGIVVNPTWSLLKPGVNPNFYTCGIEHEGKPDDVWPDEQLAASAALILQIAARWAIPLDSNHVIRHREIRASKTCPGNWLQLDALLARIPPGSTGPGLAQVHILHNLHRCVCRRHRGADHPCDTGEHKYRGCWIHGRRTHTRERKLVCGCTGKLLLGRRDQHAESTTGSVDHRRSGSWLLAILI